MGNPRRIQRRAEKGWRLPPDTVYVGRGTKWGNPFPFEHQRYLGKAWAVEAYAQWLTTTLQGMTLLREHLHELKGKSLASWEKLDEPSHADLLLALANEEIGARDARMSGATAAALAKIKQYEKEAAASRS
ncbi:DUF4326 domain-containing protein [Hyphomicrobium sp. LHD-15]|uniref:DUF4326 domain-containing protein n=1 Tax=Hyphomicrobium sp. LHD-15 TaxID=3072142 RepID=UPI00280D7AD3|nr:DUF4326 domain-containing protein [Hyphomicrobium sp. LHD-15]MDQ8698108.1 DUF4326 domain-containing protein [Hyphomicrobium sp. LHD-15]